MRCEKLGGLSRAYLLGTAPSVFKEHERPAYTPVAETDQGDWPMLRELDAAHTHPHPHTHRAHLELAHDRRVEPLGLRGDVTGLRWPQRRKRLVELAQIELVILVQVVALKDVAEGHTSQFRRAFGLVQVTGIKKY